MPATPAPALAATEPCSRGGGGGGGSADAFEPAYLARTPIAEVSFEGRPDAFANFRTTDARARATLDLMRHAGDAPTGMTEVLFTELLHSRRRASPGSPRATRRGRDWRRAGDRAARRLLLPAWRGVLQLRGAAQLQGQVRSAQGSRSMSRFRPAPTWSRRRRISSR
ncbi:phosphatidylglycerol lysyltransferase domain-containing protein [Mangrovicoccus ximenensis]|uniref:phosphatidylglycerol lysyltransferase domain-containing protein n=1 Tax=Mangrovicoccus ximenensis TaxID=1911570 RepID=UPI001374DB39